MGETLQIYWEHGQRAPMYINGGKPIPLREAEKRACQGVYDEVIDVWVGPIPQNIWETIRDKKKDLTKIIKRNQE